MDAKIRADKLCDLPFALSIRSSCFVHVQSTMNMKVVGDMLQVDF